MIGYLQKDEEALSNFLPGILAGLAESSRPEAAQSLMESWIDQGRHLAALAHYLHFTESTPADLVAKVGHKAIEVRDRMAAMGILGAIIARQLLLLVDGTFSTLGDATLGTISKVKNCAAHHIHHRKEQYFKHS